MPAVDILTAAQTTRSVPKSQRKGIRGHRQFRDQVV